MHLTDRSGYFGKHACSSAAGLSTCQLPLRPFMPVDGTKFSAKAAQITIGTSGFLDPASASGLVAGAYNAAKAASPADAQATFAPRSGGLTAGSNSMARLALRMWKETVRQGRTRRGSARATDRRSSTG